MFDQNAYLRELEQLVNIDSGQDSIDGINRIASFFKQRFKRMGWLTQLHDYASEGGGSCLVCRNREADHYDVMLVGHMDTVFPAGTANQRPYHRDGNRAFGPGVCDMKQGCLTIYHALKELPPSIADRLNILAIFNPDEEIGSKYSAPLLDRYAAQCDYAYVFEAASVQNHAHCVERKGKLGCHVEFHGVCGHAGYVFENGATSAVSEMARWIVALDELADRQKGTSVNVGVANGGIAANVVPDYAVLELDVRLEQRGEGARIQSKLAELKASAAKHGVAAEIRGLRLTPPLVPNEAGRAYFGRVERLAANIGQPFRCARRGGLSDANHIARQGCICIDGLGPAGGDDHSANEYLLIDDIEPSIALAQAMLVDLADTKGKG